MPAVLRQITRPQLRQPPVAAVRRAASHRFPGFPDIRECWEQSKAHRDYFKQYLDCDQRAQYHADNRACKPFDRLIVRWATTPALARTFFTHYNIVGRVPRSYTYLDGLVKNRELLTRYAQCSLRKKLSREYGANALPVQHANWPLNFNLFDLFFSDEERQEALEAVEKCITRRIMFRNACVKACCSKSNTESHDTFLLILQILRAQLIIV